MSGSDSRRDRGRLSRHDLLLAVIPSAFVVGLLVAHLLSVPVRTGLTAASVVGALALVDALFLNPPRGPDSRGGVGGA